MQISVQHEDELLRDSVQWDLSQPFSTPEQYASVLCEDLGLRYDWYKAIVEHVSELLLDCRQVCFTQ